MDKPRGHIVIFSILFMLLLLICMAGLLFFLFFLYLPSLRKQAFNTENPLFSSKEFATPLFFVPKGDEDISSQAAVLCSYKKPDTEKHFAYTGMRNCKLFTSLYDDSSDCVYSCIGLGSCLAVCSRKAIVLENGTALVTKACNGCGKCVSVCPRKIIRMVPRHTAQPVLCKGKDEDSSCPERSKVLNLVEKNGRGFQFWQKCYKILYGAKKS